MLAIIAAALVSFVPSLLLFYFLRNNRKDDEVYRRDCLSLLGKGVLIAGLVFLLDLLLMIPWTLTGISEKYPIIGQLFKCFIINATVEEFSKFWIARKYIRKDLDKTSRLDVISYLAIAAISFGLFEDVIYTLETNLGQILVRGLLMGHVPYELLMGQLYGKSVAEKKPFCKFLAFFVPILLHGSYNFCLGENLPDWTAFVVVAEVAVLTIYMIRMIFFIKKRRNDPSYTCPIFDETKENHD